MNWLSVFSYQVVILATLYRGCQSNYIQMNLLEVQVADGLVGEKLGVFHQQVLVKVSEVQDTYFFLNEKLATLSGQTFTSQDVEIRSVFHRTLHFSLATATMNVTLFCEFTENKDLQQFYSQIRKTFPAEGPMCASVHRSVMYALNRGGAGLANNGLFYKKPVNKPKQVRAGHSFNLVRQYSKWNEATGTIIQTQEADLVFLSRTFNVTDVIGADKIGLCLMAIPNNAIILLRFADPTHASIFRRLVQGETNPLIDCRVSDEWLAQRRQTIDALEPMHLPQLPYLR